MYINTCKVEKNQQWPTSYTRRQGLPSRDVCSGRYQKTVLAKTRRPLPAKEEVHCVTEWDTDCGGTRKAVLSRRDGGVPEKS